MTEGLELQQEHHVVIRDPEGRITSRYLEICRMDGTLKSTGLTTYDSEGQIAEHVEQKFDGHGKLIGTE